MSAEISRRPRNLLIATLLIALTVVTAVFVTLGITRTYGATAPTGAGIRPVEASATAVRTRPTLLVIGDSFAGGTGDPSYRSYPGILADEMGWKLDLDAQGGSGFVAQNTTGVESVPFIDRLEQDKSAFHPDYIIVDGGRNDLDKPLATVLPAMEQYLTEVRNAWPEATIVAVVPSYITDVEPAGYPAIRDAIVQTADTINAHVIDPVAEGWYQPMNPELLWTDGVHPSAGGSEYLAGRLAQDLRNLGLGGPTS